MVFSLNPIRFVCRTHFYHEMFGVFFMELSSVQSWAGIDEDAWTKPSTQNFASLGFPFASVATGAEGCVYLVKPDTGQVVVRPFHTFAAMASNASICMNGLCIKQSISSACLTACDDLPHDRLA